MNRITVLLADDNSVVRRGFRKLLEAEDHLEVVGEAKNGIPAVAMVSKLRPALVRMNIAMPLLDVYVEAATNSGAMGYLLKPTCADGVCPAIREVEKGNTFFSPPVPRRLGKRNRKEQLD